MSYYTTHEPAAESQKVNSPVLLMASELSNEIVDFPMADEKNDFSHNAQANEKPICLISEVFSLAKLGEEKDSFLDKKFDFSENSINSQSTQVTSQEEFLSLFLEAKKNSTSKSLAKKLDSPNEATDLTISPGFLKSLGLRRNNSSDSKFVNKARPNKCVVPCCGYSQPLRQEMGGSPRRTLFKFRKDKVEDWTSRIEGLEVEDVRESSKVCEAHFETKFIIDSKNYKGRQWKILSPSAFPSLNLSAKEDPTSKSSDENLGSTETVPDKKLNAAPNTTNFDNRKQSPSSSLNSTVVLSDLSVTSQGTEEPSNLSQEEFPILCLEEEDSESLNEKSNKTVSATRESNVSSLREFSGLRLKSEENLDSKAFAGRLNFHQLFSSSTNTRTQATPVIQESNDFFQKEFSGLSIKTEIKTEENIIVVDSNSSENKSEQSTEKSNLENSINSISKAPSKNMDFQEAVSEFPGTKNNMSRNRSSLKTQTPNDDRPRNKNHSNSKPKLKNKSGPRCIVPSCGYIRPSIFSMDSFSPRSLFKFPKELKAEDWVNRIDGLRLKDVKANSKICDAHFDPKFIKTRKTKLPKFRQFVLSPDAYPTLNLVSQENKPVQKCANSLFFKDNQRVLREIAQKLQLPAPLLKRSKIKTGVRLMWNMTITDEHDKVKSFEVFATKDKIPNVESMKKIGEVQMVPLPMSCDLNSEELAWKTEKYSFAVRPVYVNSQFGKYSNFC